MPQFLFSQVSLRYVAETRNPSDRLSFHELRLRITLVNAAVPQFENIALCGHWVGIKTIKRFDKTTGIDKAFYEKLDQLQAVFILDDLRRHIPHFHKFLIAGHDLAVETHNDNAVGRRFECRRKKRNGIVQRCLSLPPFADIAAKSLDPDRNTVSHYQSGAEFERNAAAVLSYDIEFVS